MKKDYKLQASIDKELLAWLRQEAASRHCSIAQIVRDLIVRAKAQQNQKKMLGL